MANPCWAQRRGPTISPEISEGKVTFRIAANDAKSVQVVGQWPDGTKELTKNENGVWEVTVEGIPSGVWEYGLRIDGIRMIDPSNVAIKPQRSPNTSILHVPSNPPALHDYQDVPHGTVHTHDYRSKAAEDVRQFAVYTPPGYESSTDKYPLLVLQHGSGDNQATWVAHGKANWIIDNLIAGGKAKPMVVVMLNGHVAPASRRQDNVLLFRQDLLEQVLPEVEKLYRVETSPSKRAIVGLSMGGGQSLTVGLQNSDKFAYVGGFSAAVPNEESIADALKNADQTNKNLELLWIACGNKDFLLERNQQFIELLKTSNIEHQWLETEGDHSWPIWRDYLGQFVPMLFQ